ncbi:hypothetical protein WD019_04840 [Fictibacillus sp. Mic-4]|uniref:hypothetical protein n=1 Tax=Fictibacillus TaxID=1329200 RepID=UPI000405FEF6|nr:hypothetical protein [Fictibacillus gelatini]
MEYVKRFFVVIMITLCIGILFIGGRGGFAGKLNKQELPAPPPQFTKLMVNQPEALHIV